MKLVSINVGQPREITWNGATIFTSIFKKTVEGPRKIENNQVEGDRQGDTKNHGGEVKAVYSYDLSHYAFWEQQLERSSWDYGLFGENFTTEGLRDDTVFVGDVFQIGTVQLKAIQPRFPCGKLDFALELSGMLGRFRDYGGLGIYFSIVEEGTVQAGDEIKLIHSGDPELSIQDVANCLLTKGKDQIKLQKILANPLIPERAKTKFKTFLL